MQIGEVRGGGGGLKREGTSEGKIGLYGGLRTGPQGRGRRDQGGYRRDDTAYVRAGWCDWVTGSVMGVSQAGQDQRRARREKGQRGAISGLLNSVWWSGGGRVDYAEHGGMLEAPWDAARAKEGLAESCFAR